MHFACSPWSLSPNSPDLSWNAVSLCAAAGAGICQEHEKKKGEFSYKSICLHRGIDTRDSEWCHRTNRNWSCAKKLQAWKSDTNILEVEISTKTALESQGFQGCGLILYFIGTMHSLNNASLSVLDLWVIDIATVANRIQMSDGVFQCVFSPLKASYLVRILVCLWF